MKKAKRDTYRFGLMAESFAAWGLRLRGWRILARRYKTPMGEIDLIARRGEMVAFIEVKARGDLSTALQAVSVTAQKRIGRAANHFLARHTAHAGCCYRFDIIAVAPPFYWQHLDNAWEVTT